MPNTPNRGYTYPTDPDPATVPADLAVPLTQIDADVQTLVDESTAKVGLNEDGTAPPALEAQIRDLISTEAPPPDLSAYSTTAEAEVMVDGKIEAALAETDSMIPIFPTLAEAQAWELANPGRVALTTEDQSPDTVPPTPGTLGVQVADVYADLTAAGAQDDRAITGYSFRVDSGSWSAWQSENTYTVSGLTADTDYTFQHRVRDLGENIAVGAAVQARTLTEAPVPYNMAVQTINPPFYMLGDGSGNAGWGAMQYIQSGNASQSGAALAGWPDSRRLTVGGYDRFSTGEPMPENSPQRSFSAAVAIRFDNFVADHLRKELVTLGGGNHFAIVGKERSDATEWDIRVGDIASNEVLAGPFSLTTPYTGTHVFGVDCDATTSTYYVDGLAVHTAPAPTIWSGFRSGVYVSVNATGAVDWRGFVIDEAPLGASVHADLASKGLT